MTSLAYLSDIQLYNLLPVNCTTCQRKGRDDCQQPLVAAMAAKGGACTDYASIVVHEAKEIEND